MENLNILASCQKFIQDESLASNCSGFVKAVSRDFGITLEGQANEIFEYLNKNASIKFGVGSEAATQAAIEAASGTHIVIGASYNKNGNGHVVIVTGQDKNDNVLVYGGSLNNPENASVNDRIQKRAWAKFKITNPFIAKEPPYFFAMKIPTPYKG